MRELRLDDGYVAAASGLARARGRLYVAADDAFALAMFEATGAAPGRLLRLTDGELPHEPVERKASKPDLEAVASLPTGGLVVLGSGSSSKRHRGFVVTLDGEDAQELDLRPLHQAIARELGGDVNLEGAEWHAGALVLAHRGAGGAPSALIRVGWPELDVQGVELVPAGIIGGVASGLTDLARLPDGRLLASWAAEATDNAYDDGAVAGSAIGVLGDEPWQLDGDWKVEGLWSDGREVLMVTDADDASKPAVLLRALLPA